MSGPAHTPHIQEDIRTPLHEGLIGTSAAMREVRSLVARLAQSDITVLVTGESGTGKDITARLIHRFSPRGGKPFIKVNCPAIPEGILESELFGHEKGAFTGAQSEKPGRFELANNGTIFLDEIAETSVVVQGKLLQVLDGEPFMRIGGVNPIQADVRVIAATNVNLEAAVEQGVVREDLFYRLQDVTIRMPALRERREDIGPLAEHFNFNQCARQTKTYRAIPSEYIARMTEQDWPGNVRELATRVKKYVTTGDPETLLQEAAETATYSIATDSTGPQDSSGSRMGVLSAPAAQAISPRQVPDHGFPPLKEAVRQAVEETERRLIGEALKYTLWNRRRAAKLLGISYSSLLRRIDAYEIGKNHAE